MPYRKVREFHQAGTNAENAVYGNTDAGRIQVFIDLWSRVFTGLTGDIPEISVFMQTNDSNDAPPIVGTSYGPGLGFASQTPYRIAV